MTAFHGAISDPGAIDCPRLRALLRYWHEKRGARTMPARRDIDPLEIPHLLPIVLLADAGDPAPYIRLIGTEATAEYGAEMGGRSIRDFEFGDFGAAWVEAFRAAAAEAQPILARGGYLGGAHPGGERSCVAEALLLPLSPDEVVVTHIFGGLVITPAPFTASGKPAAQARTPNRELYRRDMSGRGTR